MNISERGLGRGLGSLLSSASENSSEETRKLALTQLVPGKHQPRKYFDSAALSELAMSIRNQGVIQPLLVRQLAGMPQRYEIVAGERRWRAAKLAGLTEVPVIVTEYSDKDAMTVALVENLQREDLNPLEEAEALQALRLAHGLSQEALAEQLGKSRSAVANSLRLLQLPPTIQEGLARGDISAGHARALLAVADPGLRAQLYAAIMEQHLSVREAEAAAEVCKRNGRLPEKLLPSSGQAPVPPSPRASKSQALKDLQVLLRSASGTKATISGTEAKGRIQIPYSSPEELARIIELLGRKEEE
ncbi:ParB/RepB/Spo0J family partition protein [Mailhella sp.]|uniref:ParB/RepB/Spo0J family partition protein n=1 Tax=Mailhella sp. TaxID=1981029 RepID=UPI004063A3B0